MRTLFERPIYFDAPLGITTLGRPRKEVAPLIIAAAIAAGASLVATGASASAQASANKKNMQLQNETNQMNYQLAQEQKDFAREIYSQQLADNRADAALARQQSLEDRDFENVYNSPSAQMQRYRAAGLNPYLMMDNNAPVGSVQAQPQAVNPASYSVPQQAVMQAPHYDASWAQTLAQGGVQVGNIVADTAAKMAEQDMEMIKVLEDSNYDWSTKNFMIKNHKFRFDKYQNMAMGILEEQYYQSQYESAMKEVAKLFQQELNDEQRRQFNRNIQLHTKTINKMEAEYQNMLKQGVLFDDEHKINDEKFKILEKQAAEIERYEGSTPEWVKTFISILKRVTESLGFSSAVHF